MTRGFVTVATGRLEYYMQACNLLHSFRLHNPEWRFAILCDCENEFTREFDDVVLLKDATKSYKDKFRLLTDCPYDENIFIETDCLVYHDVTYFWNLLAKEWDLTSFGWNDGKITAWFHDERCVQDMCAALGVDTISQIPIFNPGYMFIRKGETAKKIYRDILLLEECLTQRWQGKWNLFVGKNLRDDPLFCVVMEANGMKCAAEPKEGKCIFLPTGYTVEEIDIVNGSLAVRDKNGALQEQCAVLHYSSRRAREEWLYSWQVAILNAKIAGASPQKLNILSSEVVKNWFRTKKLLQKVKRRFLK